MLRFVVRVRRETVAAHLFSDRQRVLGDVAVAATADSVNRMIADAASSSSSSSAADVIAVVVVWREIHEDVLHVDGDAERFLENRRADHRSLVFLAAAQDQHDGAHAQQDQRGGRQDADQHFH